MACSLTLTSENDEQPAKPSLNRSNSFGEVDGENGMESLALAEGGGGGKTNETRPAQNSPPPSPKYSPQNSPKGGNLGKKSLSLQDLRRHSDMRFSDGFHESHNAQRRASDMRDVIEEDDDDDEHDEDRRRHNRSPSFNDGYSLHAGANLVDGKFFLFFSFFLFFFFYSKSYSNSSIPSLLVSKALGHSSVAITSIYLHSSGASVSELIDLCSTVDDELVDDSITYVKTEKIKIEKKKSTSKMSTKKTKNKSTLV